MTRYRISFTRSDGILQGMPEGTPEESVVECEEFVQITYDEVRTGPDGDPIGRYFDGGWEKYDDELPYSDVIISAA